MCFIKFGVSTIEMYLINIIAYLVIIVQSSCGGMECTYSSGDGLPYCQPGGNVTLYPSDPTNGTNNQRQKCCISN